MLTDGNASPPSRPVVTKWAGFGRKLPAHVRAHTVEDDEYRVGEELIPESRRKLGRTLRRRQQTVHRDAGKPG